MGEPISECAVKVAVRERPARDETGDSIISHYDLNPNVVSVDEYCFTFDCVLGSHVPQQELFGKLIKPLIDKVKLGFNCTVLAYGQTGTGKTYTMGLSSLSYEGRDMGVIPRCLKELINIEENDENVESVAKQKEITISFIEIYSENVFDLIQNSKIQARGHKFTGGIRKPISSIADGLSLLIQGAKNRHVRPTNQNAGSSRSHAIFTIHLQSKCGERQMKSCFNFVDLAGTERVHRTEHQGKAMSEGVKINQGLFCLNNVLLALAQGNKVIPYRESVLTSVLQDSLNAHSFLTFLACISPDRIDRNETLSTLRYAQNAKQLKISPEINAISAAMKRNKAKTPYKMSTAIKVLPTPLHTKRSHTGNMFRSGKKSNTFCTPNNQFNGKRNNCTNLGLMSTVQQKAQHCQPSINVRASVLNGTMDMCTSTMSFDVSSSTSIGAVPNTSINYSPIVRQCMAEYESILKSKIMDTIRKAKAAGTQRPLIELNTPVKQASQVNSLVRQNSLTVCREVEEHMEQVIANSTLQDTREEAEQSASTVDSSIESNKSFTTSSPIFKMPQPPGVNNLGVISKRFNTPKDFSVKTLTRDQDPVVSTSFLENSLAQNTVIGMSFRRSRRISERLAKNVSMNGSAISLALNETHALRSRTKRLATLPEIPERAKKVHPMRKAKPNTASGDSSKQTTLAKHRKGLLDLLNNGSTKALKGLPLIGDKTAYYLVQHRVLNGKFRNFKELEQLPIWRGSAWERFAEANFLI